MKIMTDKEIVSLFFNKDDNAISVASEKFGAYCKKIAMNILGNNCDAEECVNDTFLKTWNSIPPQNPENLSAYLGKITRNISLDIHRKRNAEKQIRHRPSRQLHKNFIKKETEQATANSVFIFSFLIFNIKLFAKHLKDKGYGNTDCNCNKCKHPIDKTFWDTRKNADN